MTYFEGFIAPVPEANRDAYLKHSTGFAPLVQEIGVRRMVENWEDDVPDGKVTDFRKAVDAKPGEKIVFSFFEYPSRSVRDAANEKFRSDPRMAEMGKDMPFDGKRMVMAALNRSSRKDRAAAPTPTDLSSPFRRRSATPIASSLPRWPRCSASMARRT